VKTAKEVSKNGRGLLANLALLIISTVLALLFCETALRLLGWSPMYVSPERARFWKYDSLLGWAHQPGQESLFETKQFHINVRINQEGLRDREHVYERTNNTSRILVLGDSFAWGYGVEEDQRFTRQLETTLGVEVINAGVSGYSTDQELIWYRKEGIKYDVDLVILVFSGNDIGDNHHQLVNTIYYKPQFVLEDDHLSLTGYPVPETSTQGKLIYSISQRSALAYFLIQRYFNLVNTYGELKRNSGVASSQMTGVNSSREAFDLTTALLKELRKIAKTKDAKFMIVATDRWWNGPPGVTYDDFMDELRAEGFLVLDVESIPGFDPEIMNIPEDGHWNQEGHEFVGMKIKDFIESNQLLSK
jgi:lysophospholipase L1-like esterase